MNFSQVERLVQNLITLLTSDVENSYSFLLPFTFSSKSSLAVVFFQINDRQQFRTTKIRPSSYEGFIHIIMLMSLNIYNEGLYYLRPHCLEGNYILLPSDCPVH